MKRELFVFAASHGAHAPTSFPGACGARVPPEHTAGFCVFAFAYLFIIIFNVPITEHPPHPKHVKKASEAMLVCVFVLIFSIWEKHGEKEA